MLSRKSKQSERKCEEVCKTCPMRLRKGVTQRPTSRPHSLRGAVRLRSPAAACHTASAGSSAPTHQLSGILTMLQTLPGETRRPGQVTCVVPMPQPGCRVALGTLRVVVAAHKELHHVVPNWAVGVQRPCSARTRASICLPHRSGHHRRKKPGERLPATWGGSCAS